MMISTCRPRILNRPILQNLAACLVLLSMISLPAAAASPADFKLKDTNGDWFTLSDHLGNEVIYLTFWATWCVPCRREMPHLQDLADEYGDDGLMIVGINTDTPATKSKIKPYLRQQRVKYRNILDPDSRVLDKYNPTRDLPYGVLIGPDGNIAELFVGYRAGDEIRLKKAVEALLAEKGSESTDD